MDRREKNMTKGGKYKLCNKIWLKETHVMPKWQNMSKRNTKMTKNNKIQLKDIKYD